MNKYIVRKSWNSYIGHYIYRVEPKSMFRYFLWGYSIYFGKNKHRAKECCKRINKEGKYPFEVK